MSKYEFLIALISVIVGGTTIASVVASISKAVTKRGMSGPSDGSVARIDDRLSRMEQAIDAMAVEMERISEGQRFTTKLLSERSVANGEVAPAGRERLKA